MDTYNAHSPFTIRLELLKLAQSIENDRIWIDRNKQEQVWQMKRDEADRKGYVEVPEYPDYEILTYKDIIRVAEELNKFVSSKG